MKIILRQDVENLGESGTLHDVKGGYARNYLIPQGMAVLATEGEMKVFNENQKVKERKIARQEQELQDLADKIQGTRLEFEARAGQQGRLFGSVTSAEIAEKLEKAIDADIDRRRVVLDEPIRSTGEHTVSVHLVGRLRPEITVNVTGIFDSEAAAAEEGESSVTETDREDSNQSEVADES